MSHGLLQYDTMVSGSSIVPWHGEETIKSGQTVVCDGLMTAEDCMAKARLDWNVALERLWFGPGQAGARRTMIKDEFAIVRQDTGDYFGNVGNRYTLVQNRECFSFFDTLVGEGSAVYDTAGSLENGKIVWIMAKLNGSYFVGKDDKYETYMLLVSSHDGSKAITCQLVSVRVVCANTLSAALKGATNRVYIRHTPNYRDRASEAHKTLGLAVKYQTTIQEQLSKLTGQLLTQDQYNQFTRMLLGVTDIADESTRSFNIRQELSRLFRREPSGQTLYGALNSITDYADHHMGMREGTTRMQSALLGAGDKLKSQAFELLTRDNIMQDLLAKDVAPKDSQLFGSDFAKLMSK